MTNHLLPALVEPVNLFAAKGNSLHGRNDVLVLTL